MKNEQETEAVREELVKEERAATKEDLPETEKEIRENGKDYELLYTEYEDVYEDQETPVTRTEQVVLTSEDTSGIARSMTEDGVTYQLEESSITVEVSKSETLTGTDIIEEYVTYTMPDNDIDRLTRQIAKDGQILDLISVNYQVASASPSGVPLSYTAVCRYAANIEVSETNPVEWTATVIYNGVKTEQVLKEVVARSTYGVRVEAVVEHTRIHPAVIVTGVTGVAVLGAFFVFLFFRKRNQLEIYMPGTGGEVRIGSAAVKKKNGHWEAVLPEKIVNIPDINMESVTVKPAKAVLKHKGEPIKIRLLGQTVYVGTIQKEMKLGTVK